MEENKNTDLQKQAELEQQNSNESNNQNIVAEVANIKFFGGENIDEDNICVTFKQKFEGFQKNEYDQYVKVDINYISFKVAEFYKKFFEKNADFGYFFRFNRKKLAFYKEQMEDKNLPLKDKEYIFDKIFELNEDFRDVTSNMTVVMNRSIKTNPNTGRDFFDTEIVKLIFMIDPKDRI